MLLIPASLLTRADIDRTAAEDSLTGLLNRAELLATALEATALGSFRPEESAAADEACGLVSLAADALRAGRDRLRGFTAADLMDELADHADAARAEARRVVS